jgi:hypothetical protein
MLLETFSPEVALEYLTSEGVPEGSARELNRIARGHPLALSLGSALYFATFRISGPQERLQQNGLDPEVHRVQLATSDHFGPQPRQPAKPDI